MHWSGPKTIQPLRVGMPAADLGCGVELCRSNRQTDCMAISPTDCPVPAPMRPLCEALLAAWDASDPWDARSRTIIGSRLQDAVLQACAPRVPQFASVEAAAKFLRQQLAARST